MEALGRLFYDQIVLQNLDMKEKSERQKKKKKKKEGVKLKAQGSFPKNARRGEREGPGLESIVEELSLQEVDSSFIPNRRASILLGGKK